MLACLMLGSTFLKSFNVASSYCNKTHCKSFLLYWISKDAIITWSKGCNTLVTLGGRNTKVMLLNFKVEKPRDLPTLAKLTNMWRCIIQNHNHLSNLAFELIVELQNPSFKYIPLHLSCFICVPLNILKRLPPSQTSWLLRRINHKQLQLISPN